MKYFQNKKNAGAIAIMLFGLLLLAYNWNGSPLLGNDTRPARLVAINLIKRGSVNLDVYAPIIRSNSGSLPYYAMPSKNGHIVSRFGVGTPIAATPFFAAGMWLLDDKFSDSSARLLAKFASSFYIAATAVLMFYVGLQIGATPVISLWAALVYGLGTVAFSLGSQALWQHGPANFFLMAAIALLFKPTRISYLLTGCCVAAMVSCRPPTILLALSLLLYLVVHERRNLAWWLMGLLPIALLQGWYNHIHFGAPWRFGQILQTVGSDAINPNSQWLDTPIVGILGLLISPSRGLFIYSPIFLMLLWQPITRMRELPKLWHFMLIGSMATIVMLGFYSGWHGGWCFGYRMLADVVPILVIALLPSMKVFSQDKKMKWILAILFGVSVAIHTLGAYCYDPFSWDLHPDIDHHQERLWDIADTQLGYLLKHLKLR